MVSAALGMGRLGMRSAALYTWFINCSVNPVSSESASPRNVWCPATHSHPTVWKTQPSSGKRNPARKRSLPTLVALRLDGSDEDLAAHGGLVGGAAGKQQDVAAVLRHGVCIWRLAPEETTELRTTVATLASRMFGEHLAMAKAPVLVDDPSRIVKPHNDGASP